MHSRDVLSQVDRQSISLEEVSQWKMSCWMGECLSGGSTWRIGRRSSRAFIDLLETDISDRTGGCAEFFPRGNYVLKVREVMYTTSMTMIWQILSSTCCRPSTHHLLFWNPFNYPSSHLPSSNFLASTAPLLLAPLPLRRRGRRSPFSLTPAITVLLISEAPFEHLLKKHIASKMSWWLLDW